ncbi:hypothetical protein PCASD_10088 [Puccinia coronata f. sp. avenae]|uniref:Uncharacterized protein n=1 Tax=Puccinia coronata f. sp. avenae TaxID=200324 RepID=A0A2N5UW75_9BASI|nr:hypothetical protein PCASD_10088 [Puccinia coronata f. sp. avenae]
MLQGWSRNQFDRPPNSYKDHIQRLEGVVNLLLAKQEPALSISAPSAPLTGLFRYTKDCGLIPLLSKATERSLAASILSWHGFSRSPAQTPKGVLTATFVTKPTTFISLGTSSHPLPSSSLDPAKSPSLESCLPDHSTGYSAEPKAFSRPATSAPPSTALLSPLAPASVPWQPPAHLPSSPVLDAAPPFTCLLPCSAPLVAAAAAPSLATNSAASDCSANKAKVNKVINTSSPSSYAAAPLLAPIQEHLAWNLVDASQLAPDLLQAALKQYRGSSSDQAKLLPKASPFLTTPRSLPSGVRFPSHPSETNLIDSSVPSQDSLLTTTAKTAKTSHHLTSTNKIADAPRVSNVDPLHRSRAPSEVRSIHSSSSLPTGCLPSLAPFYPSPPLTSDYSTDVSNIIGPLAPFPVPPFASTPSSAPIQGTLADSKAFMNGFAQALFKPADDSILLITPIPVCASLTLPPESIENDNLTQTHLTADLAASLFLHHLELEALKL